MNNHYGHHPHSHTISIIFSVGANFSFCFRFLTLVIVYSFCFAPRYFVNYAPLLRAVCKFGYIVCYLALFFLPESISVTAFVAVDIFFSVSLNHQPLLSSAFGKRLRFHRFL